MQHLKISVVGLRCRYIQGGLDGNRTEVAEAAVLLHVAHDADDFTRAGQMAADRILAVKVAGHERLARHRHLGAVGRIRLAKHPPGEYGNTEGFEISGRGVDHLDAVAFRIASLEQTETVVQGADRKSVV